MSGGNQSGERVSLPGTANEFPPVTLWPTALKLLYNAHYSKTIKVFSGQLQHVGGKSGSSTSMPTSRRDLATSDAANNLTVLDVLGKLRTEMQKKRVPTPGFHVGGVFCATERDCIRERDLDEIFITFLLDEFEVCCSHHLLYKVEKDVLAVVAAGTDKSSSSKQKMTKVAAGKQKTEDDYSYVHSSAQYARQLPLEYLLRFLALLPGAIHHYRCVNQTYDHNVYMANVGKISAMIRRGGGDAKLGAGAGGGGGGGGNRAGVESPTPPSVVPEYPEPQVGVKRGRDGKLVVGDNRMLGNDPSPTTVSESATMRPATIAPPTAGGKKGSQDGGEESQALGRQQSVLTSDEALYGVHMMAPHCLLGSRTDTSAFEARAFLLLQLLAGMAPAVTNR